MINEKLEKAINEQINKEFYSAYLYLSMTSYLQDIGLNGFANWLHIQAKEEVDHAMGFYNYLINRSGRVVLDKIEKPKTAWGNVIEIFQESLEHEKYITDSINKLADIADEVKDRAAASFLDWYIDEQVEEEALFTDILCKLKLIESDGHALFNMDKDMCARTYQEHTIG